MRMNSKWFSKLSARETLPLFEAPRMDAVSFYFDFLSPYAYLAWRRATTTFPLPLDPQPVLLAGLLNATGTLGPAEIPSKRKYVFQHVVRLARDYDLTINAPHTHPFNPLLALRWCCVQENVQNRVEVVDRLFRATWEEGLDVSSVHGISQIFPDFDPALITPKVKETLRQNTSRALEEGVFGVPSFVIQGDVYWGCESLSHAVAKLEGRDPLAGQDLSGWLSVRASANR